MPLLPWHGPARGFSFVREVQPVLDRHCVSCHGPGGSEPYLKGDRPLADWSRPQLETLLTERDWAPTRVRNALGV